MTKNGELTNHMRRCPVRVITETVHEMSQILSNCREYVCVSMVTGDGSFQLDLNMSRIKTLMVLFLVSLVALNQTTAEYEKKSQESRFGVASLTKKNKELKFSPFLESYKGREEQLLENLPDNFKVLLKSAISVETTLFCVALLYGIFHLRGWDPLCRKWVRNKEWTEELEMVEIG
ncbi:hypothetical protein R3I94_016707 [Phoxinus phoxinus]|uniref:Uncharacterized protein n=1 Tax=Phoxinus phoxinus TaxID=58324 RepID=A0AAN9GZP1_9TELE